MPIIADRGGTRFLLTAGNMSYAVAVENGSAYHLYWGEALRRLDDLPEVYELLCQRNRHWTQCETMEREYPEFYGEFYNEPAIRPEFADGAHGCRFVFAGSDAGSDPDGAETLRLDFRAEDRPLALELHYRIHPRLPLLDRWSVITNTGDAPVRLADFASAAWQLPRHATGWRLTRLDGRWGKEAQIQRVALAPGKYIHESRTGISGPFSLPFFMLDDGTATEESGEVYFGALQWSGNWRIVVERDAFDRVTAIGGINPFDTEVELAPGERFETPPFTAGWTPRGFGEASRIFHRCETAMRPYARAGAPMPVICNSWGNLGIDVNERNLLELIDRAAGIGAELFVIDDGWQRSLGDWEPDPVKFPRGLAPVIAAARARGMKFGLWVEIEAFELKSRLYREHPEWALRYPGREPFTRRRIDIDRTSVMINFALPEVAEHFHRLLRDLVASTGIDYLKLDMNNFMSAPGWGDAPPPAGARLRIDYVRNFHRLFDRLSAEFPSLLLENCASGAGRSDLAMAHRFDRMNRSDNQDAHDMVLLHEGFTMLHAPRFAGGGCHISDSMKAVNDRATPLEFQAACGMLGSLACGKDLARTPKEELETIARYIALYKKLRHILNAGDFYRIRSPREGNFAVYGYLLPDRSEAVIFAFGFGIGFCDKLPRFRVPDLDPDAVYTIECHHDRRFEGRSASVRGYPPVSGRGAATVGLRVELLGDYDFRILHLRRQD